MLSLYNTNVMANRGLYTPETEFARRRRMSQALTGNANYDITGQNAAYKAMLEAKGAQQMGLWQIGQNKKNEEARRNYLNQQTETLKNSAESQKYGAYLSLPEKMMKAYGTGRDLYNRFFPSKAGSPDAYPTASGENYAGMLNKPAPEGTSGFVPKYLEPTPSTVPAYDKNVGPMSSTNVNGITYNTPTDSGVLDAIKAQGGDPTLATMSPVTAPQAPTQTGALTGVTDAGINAVDTGAQVAAGATSGVDSGVNMLGTIAPYLKYLTMAYNLYAGANQYGKMPLNDQFYKNSYFDEMNPTAKLGETGRDTTQALGGGIQKAAGFDVNKLMAADQAANQGDFAGAARNQNAYISTASDLGASWLDKLFA